MAYLNTHSSPDLRLYCANIDCGKPSSWPFSTTPIGNNLDRENPFFYSRWGHCDADYIWITIRLKVKLVKRVVLDKHEAPMVPIGIAGLMQE